MKRDFTLDIAAKCGEILGLTDEGKLNLHSLSFLLPNSIIIIRFKFCEYIPAELDYLTKTLTFIIP